jgi:uncharacterized protein (TIGR03067 family)
MKMSLLASGVWILMAVSPAVMAYPPDEMKAKLEGTWVVTSASCGGKPNGFVGDTMTFSGDKFLYTEKDGSADEGKYRIDTSKMPKHLDVFYSDNDTKEFIFALKEDKLKVAVTLVSAPGTTFFSLPGEKPARPTGFDSKDVTVILILDRKQK